MRLGRSIPIIVGSTALIFAGIWLVKVFIDRELLPPLLRVTLGGAFAVVLVGAAEWCRRRVEPIARALAICGVVVGHASIWASQRLYELIEPEPALILFGGVTAAALGLGRRFGRWVTAVGLLGGYLIPALVGPASFDPPLLFGTLALLQIGLSLDGTVRRSRVFAAITAAGSFLWYAIWWVETPKPELASPIAVLYLFGTTFISVPFLVGRTTEAATRHIASLGPGWTLALMHYFALEAERTPAIALGGFAAATVATAILRRDAWFAAAAAILPSTVAVVVTSVHDDRALYFGGLATMAVLFAGIPFALARAGRRPTEYWGCLAALALADVVLLGRFGLPGGPPPGDWGVWLLGAAMVAGAGAFALGAVREDPGEDADVFGSAWLAVAIAAGAAFEAFERADIGVAWSALAVLVTAVAGRFPFRESGTVATALLIGTGIRLLANPALGDYPIGPHPVLNWLPWGYGVPAIATAWTAVVLRRRGARDFVPFLWALAIALVLALAHLAVRHAFHSEGGTVLAGGPPGPGEGLAYSITWIVASLALFGASVWTGARALRYAGAAGMVLAVGKVFLHDTRNLDDLYRVASYFGLGVSLILLAWAYHKWIPRLEERRERSLSGTGSSQES